MREAVERDVVIEISGSRSLDVRRRAVMQVFTVRTPVEVGNLTSVTLLDPLDIGGGQLLLTDIAMFGTHALKKTFVVPPGYGPAPAGAPTVKGAPPKDAKAPGHVRLTFVTRNPPSEKFFGYHGEPCTVTVEDDGRVGTAECGAIYADGGERISFRMTWSK